MINLPSIKKNNFCNTTNTITEGIRHLTSTLVVTLHLRPLRLADRHANTRSAEIGLRRGANTEQALKVCDVTTKVLVKCRIGCFAKSA